MVVVGKQLSLCRLGGLMFDMGVLTGETVVVKRNVPGEPDPFGAPTAGSVESENVGNVLVAPGLRSDLPADRPEGVRVVFTLHFPRGYGKSLRGAVVNVRGTDYRVIGDPQAYTEVNVPGPWTMPVEVEAALG